ncbi:hypothetical protein O9992_24470 [Vibrio lentus]|nr:hypothetical protein [Vibrio lentus]
MIETGANLVVTPNFNEQVVKMSAAAGCVSFLVLLRQQSVRCACCWCDGVKLFPVSVLGLEA